MNNVNKSIAFNVNNVSAIRTGGNKMREIFDIWRSSHSFSLLGRARSQLSVDQTINRDAI